MGSYPEHILTVAISVFTGQLTEKQTGRPTRLKLVCSLAFHAVLNIALVYSGMPGEGPRSLGY
jgi:hypothetical protein